MCCLACIVPIMMNLINIKSNANDESRCRVEKGGGESTDTQIMKLFTSMSGTILPTMCQIVVVIQ